LRRCSETCPWRHPSPWLLCLRCGVWCRESGDSRRVQVVSGRVGCSHSLARGRSPLLLLAPHAGLGAAVARTLPQQAA
jgi:hypothetical protein